MMFATFAAERRKEIRDLMNELTDALARGDATSYDSYRYICGQIHGLALAERQLLDAAEIIEKVALND